MDKQELQSLSNALDGKLSELREDVRQCEDQLKKFTQKGGYGDNRLIYVTNLELAKQRLKGAYIIFEIVNEMTALPLPVDENNKQFKPIYGHALANNTTSIIHIQENGSSTTYCGLEVTGHFRGIDIPCTCDRCIDIYKSMYEPCKGCGGVGTVLTMDFDGDNPIVPCPICSGKDDEDES
jgi:hypothetical protein